MPLGIVAFIMKQAILHKPKLSNIRKSVCLYKVQKFPSITHFSDVECYSFLVWWIKIKNKTKQFVFKIIVRGIVLDSNSNKMSFDIFPAKNISVQLILSRLCKGA